MRRRRGWRRSAASIALASVAAAVASWGFAGAGCGWLASAFSGLSFGSGKSCPCGPSGSNPRVGLLSGMVFFGAEGFTESCVVLQLEFKDL